MAVYDEMGGNESKTAFFDAFGVKNFVSKNHSAIFRPKNFAIHISHREYFVGETFRLIAISK